MDQLKTEQNTVCKCEICGKPLKLRDYEQYQAEGAPEGEWPCCHEDCAEGDAMQSRLVPR